MPALLLGGVPIDPLYYLVDPLRFYYLFSLDLFGLVCLLAVVPYTAQRSRVRFIVVGSVLFLLLYQTYDAVVGTMLHRSPLFYADVPHLVGAVYLLLNAGMPWPHVLGLGGGVGVLILLGWTLPGVIRHLHRHLRGPPVRHGMLAAAVGVSLLVCLGVVTDRGIERQTYRSVCFSTAECAVRNVKASVDLNRDLVLRQSVPADSTYADYDDLRWSQPPSLYLVAIESYGSTLKASPHREAYDRFMGAVADSLDTSGWHQASAHSEAPVVGGLSWLSIASVLLGTPVAHQPTFDLLRSKLSRYPHLVRLLRRQGYTTATLQPPVRDRPGLTVDNPYAFDRTLYFQDLEYSGPTYGWGIVPDQYSLSVAHREVVETAQRPFFLFFETATSHSSWDRPPPPLVDAPESLNRSPSRPTSATNGSAPALVNRSDRSQDERLFRHIRYDWQVLTKYLRTKAPPNSLVVIVGDHQPYFAEGNSPATPLHVLSRDEELVRRFDEYGLVPGLRPSPAADTLHHAGIYSMLVRALTAHDRAATGRSAAPLPPYRPQGVARPALLRNQP